MKLTVVHDKKTRKTYYNISTQTPHSFQTHRNKTFKTMHELLDFAIATTNDHYIISIDKRIYEYIKKNNHVILHRKNFQFV